MKFFFIFTCIGFFLRLIPSIFTFRNCKYQIPNQNQMLSGVTIDPSPSGSRLKRSLQSSLRIHFEYMDSFDSYTGSQKIKKNIMEPAKIELETVLRAKNPTNGILRVNRECENGKYKFDQSGLPGCVGACAFNTKCLSTTIPDKFLKRCRIITETGEVRHSDEDGEGVADVDIILLVSVEYCTGDTFAHAASCFSEKELDRPIFGIINICHGVFHGDRNIREIIHIVKHEIIHTLGFAVDKYAFYRNSDGSPIVPRDTFGLPNLGKDIKEGYYFWNEKITKKVIRTRYSVHGAYKKSFDAFVLPNVVEVARKHFNCPAIDAVDLEDFGDTGSALTHFDEYFLYNEIMTAETNNGIDALSKFTLALLKDTGWYEVDYSAAEYYSYGKNTGCVLPIEGCFKYIEHRRKKGQSLDPFCDRIFPDGNVARCSDNREYYDYCHLSKYNSIFKENEYFRKIPNVLDQDVHLYAGKSEFNEFCPSKIVFSDPSSVCKDENNNNRRDRHNIIQSYYGPDSLCFENSLLNDSKSKLYGASCQKYNLNKEKTKLTIYYGSQSISCPSEKPYYLSFNEIKNVVIKCPDDLTIFPMLSKNSSGKLYVFMIYQILIWVFVKSGTLYSF